MGVTKFSPFGLVNYLNSWLLGRATQLLPLTINWSGVYFSSSVNAMVGFASRAKSYACNSPNFVDCATESSKCSMFSILLARYKVGYVASSNSPLPFKTAILFLLCRPNFEKHRQSVFCLRRVLIRSSEVALTCFSIAHLTVYFLYSWPE